MITSLNTGNDWIRRAFRRRHILQWILAIPIIAGGVMLGVNRNRELQAGTDYPLRNWFGFALMTAPLVLNLFVWRCPACHTYLGRGLKRDCPDCGVTLR